MKQFQNKYNNQWMVIFNTGAVDISSPHWPSAKAGNEMESQKKKKRRDDKFLGNSAASINIK